MICLIIIVLLKNTQTAHNGIIYLDKPLNKILEEIGDENLTNERLFYRIYLTSVQDKGAIVPGIASTGFFKINGLDIQIETIESSGNEKWFKHAAVEGRYVRSDKFKNPGGAINQNGAIVVDHKISKNTNFAYISAKNKPWTLEYGVDPRLVKYIGGIELYYMDAADYVNPDYSLKNKANRKVRDLSIVRTAGHKKYGYGDITENQFTQIVDVHGGRPEPITIRYVYKLNKPINEILEELRREAGVEEGEAFGKDFIFSAWITDKTKDALITNTYGTGYYRIQDIDGDGKLDEEEANNEQSPYIGVPKITAPYEGDNKVKAVVHLNENAGKGNKAQLINKNGVVVATINNVDAEENGIPKTIDRELEFTVTDSSVLGKAGDKLTVKIIPSDERYEKAEEAETKVKEAPKAVKDPLRVVKGKDLTEDTVLAKKGVENSNKMPGGTTYRWKTAPNTSQAGNTTGIVSVTVPDREEAFEVTVPIEVFLADADKYTPQTTSIIKEYGTSTTEEEIIGAVTVPGYPEDTVDELEIALDNATQIPDGNTAGDYPVDVTVTYPDGSEDKVQVTVTVKEQKDNEKYIPEFDQINKNYGEATTEEEIKGALKEESVPENMEVTVKNPENLPDGMTEGTFEIEVTVEYPDGTSEDTTVQVVVTDNRTDAEKYTPEFDQIEKNYGEATTEEEIKGALKEESVPENTEVTVKNPESLPDGMTEGTFEIEVTVEYPDGTSEDTTVQVVVTDNFLVVTKNPPKQIDGQRVAENTNVITANLTFTVEGVHDEGLNSGLSIDENGNLTGTPKLNWGDKNSDTYEEQTVVLHAIATAESGSKKPVTISVVVQRDTDGDGEPDITDTDDDGDGFTDIEEEEKGTDPKDPDSVPQVDPIVAPTIGEIEDQTVVEGNAITPVTPEVTEGSNVTVEGLPEGVMFENGTIQGTPKVTWNGSEESRAITVTVKAEKDGATGRETFVITVQRDTDGDGEPDITDTDDDGDGFTDIEEEEKGTDPKDPNSVPQVDPIVAPTIGEIEDQTVVEGNAITPVTPEVTEGSNVTVEGLPEGVMFENGTIQGTPKVTWNGSEESRAITVTVKAEKDGATARETFVITVQRDTDGDGEPDITDTDDDGDGFTDIEEEEKGTDPKDPNSVPQVDPKPVKPDQKQDPEISQNKVVNNVVNNSYKKPISNAPKTGDFGNGTGYTGLAALAAGLMLLLGIKKKRKEEDGEE